MGKVHRGFGRVVIEKQRLAVRRRSKHPGIGSKNLAAKPVELHVAPDIGAQRPHGVSQRGRPKAGIKLLGDGAAADGFAALENKRLESALGQIKRDRKSTRLNSSHGYI